MRPLTIEVPIFCGLEPPKPDWKTIKETSKPTGIIQLVAINHLNAEYAEEKIPAEQTFLRSVATGYELGEHHARALLDNQSIIPNYLESCVLFFTGTIWSTDFGEFFCIMFHTVNGWKIFHCAMSGYHGINVRTVHLY